MVSIKSINYWNHFKTIIKHKYYVFIYCVKCGIPWRGITHDLSKFSIKEFLPSARHFRGDKSPIDAEKIDKGYSIAWQHHKGHNTHHYHYWLDLDNGKTFAIKMPYKDVVELICDWVGAGRAYSPKNWSISEPYDYFIKTKNRMVLHPDTYSFIEKVLTRIKDPDDKTICKDIRKKLIDY